MRCLIIASGPSLTEADVLSTRGHFDYTIVVNDNYRICPWADLLYACDNRWWRYYDGVKEFKGQRVSPFKGCASVYGLAWYPAFHQPFSFDTGSISFGRNSGYQALNLAVVLGFKEIVLLGYDFKDTDVSHWFGEHPNQIRVSSSYELWIKDMEEIAPVLKSRGINVINSSRNTDIKCFERKEISECFTTR